MSIFYHWVDFVTFTLSPRQLTLEERMDTSNAVNISSEDYVIESETERRGFIITQNIIMFDDDEFEAMEINAGGAVTVWTKKRVWTLHTDRGLEKLYYVPRHPDHTEYEHD